jgi:hypothetical protein
MDTTHLPITSDDVLFDAERTIARRADELARLSGNNPSLALSYWLEAEREFWRELESRQVATH